MSWSIEQLRRDLKRLSHCARVTQRSDQDIELVSVLQEGGDKQKNLGLCSGASSIGESQTNGWVGLALPTFGSYFQFTNLLWNVGSAKRFLFKTMFPVACLCS